MFIKVGARATGKTTELIHDAFITGYPIVVATGRRKEHIVSEATQMKMNIEVFTVAEMKEMGARKPDSVMVDDLDDILVQALGAVVVKATLNKKG